MKLFQRDGFCVPLNCITAMQLKGDIIEIFTAFIGHRVFFDSEDEAEANYEELMDKLEEL